MPYRTRMKRKTKIFADNLSVLIRIFSVISVPLFFSNCAQVVMPNGGTKDITPPKVTKYMPDSAATNFKGKEINIVFNEYIQLKDVNNQLVVSPLLDEQPEIKLIKNHILNIEFKRALKENTTYTMNFGNSIADYNEGNEIDNFQYVFSTGSFIDSLSLSGKVQNAFDHKTEKGVLVMLYEASTYIDSTPYKKQPSYFSKTKADGTYKINNIRAGKYKVFALRDENRNYKYDESEVIGFVDQEIEINKNVNVDVEVFKEEPKKLKLMSTSVVSYGHILFVFNKPSENLKVKALNPSDIPTEILKFSQNEDSLHYWFEGVKADSLKLQLRDNEKIVDTVEVKLMNKEQALKFEKDKFKLVVKTNIIPGQKFDLNKEILLRFNHPVITSSNALNEFKKGLKLFADTTLISKDKSFSVNFIYNDLCMMEFVKIDKIEVPNKYTRTTDTVLVPHTIYLKENVKYKLLIEPNSLKDIFGLANDTIKFDFVGQEEKYYGNVKLKLILPAGKNHVLQFLDAREIIVKEEIVNEGKTFKYDYLQPGAYKLKLILDTNKDGKWSEGNYLEKTHAEKVIYYDKPITIRSNWDLELEWKINE